MSVVIALVKPLLFQAMNSCQVKKLVVEFKNGAKYEYEDVPHQLYTSFRLSESQGKFFTSEISKKFKYKKL